MNTRRALLSVLAGSATAPALHIHRTEQVQPLNPTYPHPNAALLALCAHLDAMRAEWQRLWLLTSDGPDLATKADRAWQEYSDSTWPGIAVSDHVLNRLHLTDLPGRLRTLRAVTPEGLKAKARAVMALDNAASYCDCRNDAAQIWESIVADAAGHDWPRVGEEASPPLRPVAPTT